MIPLAQKIQRSIQILLVEDNLGDATLLMEVFKASKNPVHLSRVPDGEQALEYIRGKGRYAHVQRPDIVLLDLSMPKKSGLEVLAEIKSDPALEEIPVVVLTHSELQEDVRRAYESKANFYMVKPHDLDQLYVAMRYIEDIWLSHLGKPED